MIFHRIPIALLLFAALATTAPAEETEPESAPTPTPTPASDSQPAATPTPDPEPVDSPATTEAMESEPSVTADTQAAADETAMEESMESDATGLDTTAQDDEFLPLPQGLIEDEVLEWDTEELPSTPTLTSDEDFLFSDDLPPTGADTGAAGLPAATKEPERDIRARYRKLQIQMEKDPEVVNLRQQAEAAGTDEEKRAARREYYRLLFTKMRKADPSLKERCDSMEQAYIRRLAQTRVEPTIPLKPPPTPEPLD